MELQLPSGDVGAIDVDADGEDEDVEADVDAHTFQCFFYRLVCIAGGPVPLPCYLVPGCFCLRLVMNYGDVDDEWKMARNYYAMLGRVWKKGSRCSSRC